MRGGCWWPYRQADSGESGQELCDGLRRCKAPGCRGARCQGCAGAPSEMQIRKGAAERAASEAKRQLAMERNANAKRAANNFQLSSEPAN